MEHSFDFYLPVKVATLFCHSKMLDDIGDFTKFVIWNLGARKTTSDINQVTQLPPEILTEELEYLGEHGLSTGSMESGWELTSLGQEYFALLQCINSLEKDGIPVYIDMLSGNVVFRKDSMMVVHEEEIPKDALMINSDVSISDVFFRNDNYGNTLVFAQDYLRETNLLDERYMSSLYTTLRVSREGNCFARCHVDSYLYERQPQKQELKIAIPIAMVTFKKFYNQLDEFRPVLDTLHRLRQYGNGLLSDKALLIEEIYQRECAEPQSAYWFDRFAGLRIKGSIPPDCFEDADQYTDPRCIYLPAQRLRYELRTKDMTLKPIAAEENKIVICGVSYRFT